MQSRHRWMRGPAIAGLVVACTACQSYRPLTLETVRRGARVRVTVAEPVPIQLRDVRIDRAQMVDAEAVGVENGNLVLSAVWVERVGGIGTPGEGWTVTVPVSAVSTLKERRFDVIRTVLLVGAFVVGSSLGWRTFGSGASGGATGGGGGEPL